MKKEIKSQLVPDLEGKVLIKAGLQTLEKTKEDGLAICDGWLTDRLIIYNNKGWACDGLFKINKPILNFLNRKFN